MTVKSGLLVRRAVSEPDDTQHHSVSLSQPVASADATAKL